MTSLLVTQNHINLNSKKDAKLISQRPTSSITLRAATLSINNRPSKVNLSAF